MVTDFLPHWFKISWNGCNVVFCSIQQYPKFNGELIKPPFKLVYGRVITSHVFMLTKLLIPAPIPVLMWLKKRWNTASGWIIDVLHVIIKTRISAINKLHSMIRNMVTSIMAWCCMVTNSQNNRKKTYYHHLKIMVGLSALRTERPGVGIAGVYC